MPSIIAFTLLSAITASAIPHGHNHFHLHPARSPRNLITHSVQHVGETITPIAGRSDLPLSLKDGKCGGDTGFGCGEGYCCSQWGYCGVTEDYCGAGCQFGNCNGTATGPTMPVSNGTAPEPAEYSSVEASGPVVTVQMTVTATGPAPVVTVTSSSETTDESISAAGIATKDHGPPAFSQSWAPISEGWGQPGSTPAAVPTTLATQTSATPVEPTPTPYSSVSVPAWTPEPSSAAAPVDTSSYSAPPAYTTSTTPAAPAYSQPASSGPGNGNVYNMYEGDGSASQGWPSEEQWMSFDDLWDTNLALIGINCDNSDEENANLKSAISSVSSSSGVPANYILAIIMQESKGCVRVIGTTSQDGVGNPGLMQSHSGAGSCNTNGATITPCPMDEITKMVSDGTEGTYYQGSIGGDGLQQVLANPQCSSDSSKYFQAARLYNSGSMPSKLNLAFDLAGTPCYASDIANRLMGWTTASTTCQIPVGAYSG